MPILNNFDKCGNHTALQIHETPQIQTALRATQKDNGALREFFLKRMIPLYPSSKRAQNNSQPDEDLMCYLCICRERAFGVGMASQPSNFSFSAIAVILVHASNQYLIR